ncbi:hypothetical protein ACVCEA_07570 [Escherichia coli]
MSGSSIRSRKTRKTTPDVAGNAHRRRQLKFFNATTAGGDAPRTPTASHQPSTAAVKRPEKSDDSQKYVRGFSTSMPEQLIQKQLPTAIPSKRET